MSGPDLAGWLTLAEAAALVGLSPRTLKRRVAAGDLTATKRPWGERERWEIQGAELARWAEATGRELSMTTPPGEGKPGGHDPAPVGAVSMTEPEMPADDPQNLAALAAEAANLRAQVAALEAQVAARGELLDEVRTDRDHWREAHQVTLRMLPPARVTAEPWWRRLFGGRRADEEGGGA